MFFRWHTAGILAVMTLIFVAGCATAYHKYPCGCVPLDYCPLAPLPYTQYDRCPTPIAQEFVGGDDCDCAQ